MLCHQPPSTPCSPTGVLEHLSCLLPGLLALGAHLLSLDDLRSVDIDYLGLAAGLSLETAKVPPSYTDTTIGNSTCGRRRAQRRLGT